MEIVFEDKEVIVLNKPAGMVVNRADSVSGQTVQDWVDAKLGFDKTASPLMVSRSGIAHRLDKETSGCLLVAKNEKTLVALMGQFKERQIKKEYLALVYGRLEPKEGVIRLPMKRSFKDRRLRTVDVEGKVAETGWRVEKYGNEFSLVRLFPKTGRTHQIRVHLKHLGHPIVGDKLYASKKQRQKLWHERHCLHAEKIEFVQPASGELISCKAVIPKDMKEMIENTIGD